MCVRVRARVRAHVRVCEVSGRAVVVRVCRRTRVCVCACARVERRRACAHTPTCKCVLASRQAPCGATPDLGREPFKRRPTAS
eukprot:6172577-Pleurochrysis_carterae.AAC.2